MNHPLHNGKPIDGFPFYSVCPDGTIWTCKARGRSAATKADPRLWRTLRVSHAGRYQTVSLCHQNVVRTRQVHELVARAFVGPRPQGLVIRHLDGDATNNSAANLAYGTHKDNEADKAVHGTKAQGERIFGAKLTKSVVLELRGLASNTFSVADAARKYGVSMTAISAAITGRTWKGVGGQIQPVGERGVWRDNSRRSEISRSVALEAWKKRRGERGGCSCLWPKGEANHG